MNSFEMGGTLGLTCKDHSWGWSQKVRKNEMYCTRQNLPSTLERRV